MQSLSVIMNLLYKQSGKPTTRLLDIQESIPLLIYQNVGTDPRLSDSKGAKTFRDFNPFALHHPHFSAINPRIRPNHPPPPQSIPIPKGCD